MQRSLTVISKVILCLVSRNKPPRNVLLCLWMRTLLLVLVWIHTLPKIAVDTTMVIIRTSVSGAWIVTFSVKWHICCTCCSILVSASSWLRSISSINLLEPSAFMQMHCSSETTCSRISSVLLFPSERKARHF